MTISIEKQKINREGLICELYDKTKNYSCDCFSNFMLCLLNHGFFDGISTENLLFCKEFGLSAIPTISKNGISVGVDFLNDCAVYIGIDPSNCFDSIRRCAISATFPMNKRQYCRFKHVFDALMNEKSKTRRDFLEVANTLWCGAYGNY